MSYPMVRMKFVLSANGGGAWGNDPGSDYVTPVLRSTEITLDGRIEPEGAALRELSPRECRQTILQSGDILVVKSSGSDAHLGKSGWVDERCAGMSFSNFIQRLRCSEALDPRYAWYFMNCMAMKQQVRILSSTTTGLQNLSGSLIGEIEIPCPPIKEQRRIADFLDAEIVQIGRLLELRLAEIRAVKERFDSVWSASIGDIGRLNGWCPLRRLLTAITDGPFGSSLASGHYSDSGARVIRLGNIGQARFRGDDVAYIPELYYQELRRHEVREGDLIIAGLGDENHPLGRACVAPSGLGHAIVKADCFRLRLNPHRINHEYAAWALSSPRVVSRVSEMSRGSTRARINLSIAKDIAIPVPALSDQHKLVSFLAAQRQIVDDVSAACYLQYSLLAERRQALITAAVTGQIDVTTAGGLASVGGMA